MTYIGLGLRRIRPHEPKGSPSQKTNTRSVDWKLIVNISLLLSVLLNKSHKEKARWVGLDRNRPHGVWLQTKTPRRLANVANARLEHKAAGKTGVERTPASFSKPPSFVKPCVVLTNFPSPNVFPQRRSGACWAFDLAGPLTGRPERTENEPSVPLNWLPCASSASLVLLFTADATIAGPELRGPPAPWPLALGPLALEPAGSGAAGWIQVSAPGSKRNLSKQKKMRGNSASL